MLPKIGAERGNIKSVSWEMRAQLIREVLGLRPIRSGRFSEEILTMRIIQEAARASRKFFAGLRAGAAALPRVSLRIASDRPPRSGPIPRRHNSWLSRSQWLSSDRPFATPAGPDASAAAKDSVSGSSRDAPGRGCEACGPRLRLLRRGPSNAKYGRGSPRGNFPTVA